MNVLISLFSGFSEVPVVPLAGEMSSESGRLTLSWSQLPENGASEGAKYRLRYSKSGGVLYLRRTDDCTMNLSFVCGTRTAGQLSTPQGDIEMEVETEALDVPEAFFAIEEGQAPAELFCGEGKCIRLSYRLLMSGQEPMPNEMSIWVTLAKQSGKE